VESFHDPLRQELPRLLELAERLRGHGDSHRRVLDTVRDELDRFGASLVLQMSVEERELFPLIERIEQAGPTASDDAALAAMRVRADDFVADTRQTLRILRQITDNYVPPPTACSTLHVLYRALEELEELVQLHVHLESNVLFSRAVELASDAGGESSK